jgi:hypothetical protein
MMMVAFASPAQSDDQIGVEVEVVNTQGIPEVRASVEVPYGAKSDAALVVLTLRGFEPEKPVLFAVTPSPDAIARFESDKQGSLLAELELPYGLEPGSHDIDALSFVGEEGTSASWTVGRIYVNDFGILTESDGSYPAGTKPVKVLLPTSEDQVTEPPTFQTVKGTLRVSNPQIKVSQGLLPSMSAVVSFNNDTNVPVSFEAKMSLYSLFGTLIGETYYSNINSLAPGETQAVLLDYDNLPPIGFYTLKTELILPADFESTSPVRTSYSSDIFVPSLAIWALVLVLLALIGGLVFRNRISRRESK